MPLTAGYRPCGPPERQQNTLLYPTNKGNPYFLSDSEDDEEDEDEDDNHGPVKWFAHNTEIRFNCIKGIYGEKTTWKIVCQDGNWVGGAYKCGKLSFVSIKVVNDFFSIFANLTIYRRYSCMLY